MDVEGTGARERARESEGRILNKDATRPAFTWWFIFEVHILNIDTWLPLIRIVSRRYVNRGMSNSNNNIIDNTVFPTIFLLIYIIVKINATFIFRLSLSSI